MKKSAVLFATLFLINIIQAQERFDFFGLNIIHNPAVGLMDPNLPALQNLDMDVTELDAFIRIPSKLGSENTILINGLRWHYVKAPLDDLPNDRNFDANLHSIEYSIGMIHQFSDQWGVRVMLRPTLASNFRDGISSDDFFFQGSAVAFKTVNESWRYGIGISYMNGFGEPRTFPVLAMNYKTEDVSLGIIAPVRLNFAYEPGKISYGFDIALEGGQFHLSSKPGDGIIITTQDSIKFSRYNIGPTLGWDAGVTSRFEISAGISLKRTLKAINDSGTETDYDLANGIYLSLGYYMGR